MDKQVIFAFSLTLLAGLSTAIGGLISFFIKKNKLTFLSVGLGFSAGAMIYISLVEIIHEAEKYLSAIMGTEAGPRVTILMFFAGIALTALVDKLVPDHIEPQMLDDSTPAENEDILKRHKLKRLGLFTAVALAIHNFPEGLATFTAGLANAKLGISVAIAIAIHNIPEGIAVSLPIYHATNSKLKAFNYALLSGLTEPLGALMGFFVLSFLANDLAFGLLFALVAGIMIYVSFDELLPAAREFGDGHHEILGIVIGMFVMAVSLIMF